MRGANGQHAALNRASIIHGRAFADPPIIDVAAGVARRNRIDHVSFFGCQPDHAKMRPYRDTSVLQDAMVFLNSAVVDRDARIVDGFMPFSESASQAGPSMKSTRILKNY